MKDIRIGNFLSRTTDTTNLRSGRNTFHTYRQVLLCNEQGQPTMEVCLVHFPSNVPHQESLKKLESIMAMLAAGCPINSMVTHHGNLRNTAQ